MLKKENLTLLIGLSLPVLLIIVVLLSIYIPRLSAPEPQNDFVYSIEDNYYYGGSQFAVKDSRIEKKDLRVDKDIYDGRLVYPEAPVYEEPRLFLYDVSERISREISLEDAQDLEINPSGKSPDDFSVSCGNRVDGFIFFVFDSGEDCRQQFVRGHGISTEINIDVDMSDYRYQFSFIGWIR